MENENLKIWNLQKKTNPKFTKAVSFGRKFTSIDPTYQIYKATEMWGAYGRDWGLQEIEHREITFEAHIKGGFIAVAQAIFKYPAGSFPLSVSFAPFNVKSNKFDEDYRKKMETSLLSKALSKLGFNADVFMGKFEDAPYLESLKKEMAITDAVKEALEVGDVDRLKKSISHIKNNKELKKEVENKIKENK